RRWPHEPRPQRRSERGVVCHDDRSAEQHPPSYDRSARGGRRLEYCADRRAEGRKRLRRRCGTAFRASVSRGTRARARWKPRCPPLDRNDRGRDQHSVVTPPHSSSRPAARILIVDDHAMFRGGVKLFLQRDPGLQVIAEAADAETALALAAKERPDVVLLDVDLAGFDALEIIGPLRRAAADSRGLLLTGIRGREP